MITPYRDLPDDARTALDGLIDAYLDQLGWPPGMTRAEAIRGLIVLVERGIAVFQADGEIGSPDCKFSLQIRSGNA